MHRFRLQVKYTKNIGSFYPTNQVSMVSSVGIISYILPQRTTAKHLGMLYDCTSDETCVIQMKYVNMKYRPKFKSPRLALLEKIGLKIQAQPTSTIFKNEINFSDGLDCGPRTRNDHPTKPSLKVTRNQLNPLSQNSRN